jgi:hypothetical protein
VELRSQEDDPEEQRQNADTLSLGLHVLTKTKLRPEWLRGQVLRPQKCRFGHVSLALQEFTPWAFYLQARLPVIGALRPGGSDVFFKCVDAIALHQH